jgi:hypothetical protein
MCETPRLYITGELNERTAYMRFPFTALILLLLLGCTRPGGDTWLIRTTEGEITVADAGRAWNNLRPQAREGFLSGSNPVGEFVTTLARRNMTVAEISNDSYLFSPGIQALRRSWLRSSAFIAMRDSLVASETAGITEEDLRNYRLLLGKTVWYTDPEGVTRGPERLPDLPWELAFALDTLEPGAAAELEDGSFVLDSVVTAPDSLIAATLADTVRVNAFARGSLAESRAGRALREIESAVIADMAFDSTAAAAYSSEDPSLSGETVLVTWGSNSLTADDMDGIKTLVGMSFPLESMSLQWVFHNLQNHARLEETAGAYSLLYPDDYAVLEGEADRFAMEYAGELLYTNRVTAEVSITEQMVIEAYESIEEIPMMPETRTFMSVVVPPEQLEETVEFVSMGGDPTDLGYDGLPATLAHGHSHLSRPVTPGQIPGNMATVLFMMESGNREWQRPMEVGEGLFVLFRLDSVIPSSPATFDHLEASIRQNLRAHLEEQLMMDWIRDMEQKYRLEINTGILRDLPMDPAAWSDL